MNRQRVSGEQKGGGRVPGRPRVRRGGRHVPEKCGGEGASKSMVRKGRGSVVSQKKGIGEARDDLVSFVVE